MSYANLQQLLSRAGPMREAWDDGTQPSFADLEEMLNETSDLLDARVAAYGFGVPVTDPTAANALAAVNVDLALQLAIESTPDLLSSGAAQRLKAALDARVTAYRAALEDGSLDALAYLGSTSAAEMETGASNWWTEDSMAYEWWTRLKWAEEYPRTIFTDPWGVPPDAGPTFLKTQNF